MVLVFVEMYQCRVSFALEDDMFIYQDCAVEDCVVEE